MDNVVAVNAKTHHQMKQVRCDVLLDEVSFSRRVRDKKGICSAKVIVPRCVCVPVSRQERDAVVMLETDVSQSQFVDP